MPRHRSKWLVLMLAVAGTTARAQLSPHLTLARTPATLARTLGEARAATIARLIRDHPREIARDPDGFPARAQPHRDPATDRSSA